MKFTIVIILNRKDTGPFFSYQLLGEEFVRLGYQIEFLDAFDPDVNVKLDNIYNEHNVLFTLTHNVLLTDVWSGTEGFYAKRNTICLSLTDTPLPKYDIISKAGANVGILLGDITNGHLVNKINRKVKVFPWYGYNNVVVEGEQVPMAERKIDVLFAGRVGVGETVLNQYGFVKRAFAKYTGKRFGFQNDKQIDECMRIGLRGGWRLLSGMIGFNEAGRETWSYMWHTVQYIRARRRNYVLQELLELPEHVKVVVISDKDQTARLRKLNRKNFEVLDFMPWPDVIKMMGNSRLVINALPFQVNSHHERICTTQYSGGVAVSDCNPYLKSRYTDGEDIIHYFYKRNQLRNLIVQNLGNPDRLVQIANAGKANVMNNDMPAHRVAYILDVYKRFREELDFKNEGR